MDINRIFVVPNEPRISFSDSVSFFDSFDDVSYSEESTCNDVPPPLLGGFKDVFSTPSLYTPPHLRHREKLMSHIDYQNQSSRNEAFSKFLLRRIEGYHWATRFCEFIEKGAMDIGSLPINGAFLTTRKMEFNPLRSQRHAALRLSSYQLHPQQFGGKKCRVCDASRDVRMSSEFETLYVVILALQHFNVCTSVIDWIDEYFCSLLYKACDVTRIERCLNRLVERSNDRVKVLQMTDDFFRDSLESSCVYNHL
jgi:hypothetical protein